MAIQKSFRPESDGSSICGCALNRAAVTREIDHRPTLVNWLLEMKVKKVDLTSRLASSGKPIEPALLERWSGR